jgi:HAD superfamily hydrolase (TIGR01662 family)
MIKAVLFDWGETLVHVPGVTNDYDGHKACVEAVFRHLAGGHFGAGLLNGELTWEQFHDAYSIVCTEMIERSHRTGREHRFEERFLRTLRHTGCAGELTDDHAAALVRHFSALVLDRCRLVKRAPETLRELAPRYRIGLVSNYPNAEIVKASLARLGLAQHLSAVVISAEHGWVKPHRGPFLDALQRLGVAPEDTLFVGDDVKNDMRGAKAVGMHTAWLSSGHSGPLPDPSIDIHIVELSQVLDIVASHPRIAQASAAQPMPQRTLRPPPPAEEPS